MFENPENRLKVSQHPKIVRFAVDAVKFHLFDIDTMSVNEGVKIFLAIDISLLGEDAVKDLFAVPKLLDQINKLEIHRHAHEDCHPGSDTRSLIRGFFLKLQTQKFSVSQVKMTKEQLVECGTSVEKAEILVNGDLSARKI